MQQETAVSPHVPHPSRSLASEPSDRRRWQAARLLRAPHRLAFFGGMVMLGLSGLWWALVKLDPLLGVGLPYRVAPVLAHAVLMTYGFVPLFFAGFLFTAGPKWLAMPAPPAQALRLPLGLQMAGGLAWMLGTHLSLALALGALALMALGLGLQVARFGALVRASRVNDRLHASWVVAAGAWGVLALLGVLAGLASDRLDGALGLTRMGLWGFVVTTYLVVVHRMIPFFTSSAVPMLDIWRPFWVLWALLAMVGLELVGLAAGLLGLATARGGMLLQGLVQLASGCVVLWLAFVWGLVQSLRIRLLAMLHLGFLWLGVSWVLAGLSQLLGLRLGVPLLGLGALHAMTMGFLGSLLMAMVTRVSCGHGGRSLVADGMVWALFWMLQLAVVVRIVASALPTQAGPLVLAALLWVGAMGVWSLRLMNWYGHDRFDGRPG